MNYALISIPVILRDYIDTSEDLKYKSDDHKRMIDIADSLFSGAVSIADMTPDYQTLYYSQPPELWQNVIADMTALDTQVDSHNVNDLVDDYNYLMQSEV